MLNQSYDQRLIEVSTKICRALERDTLGMKIPDLIIDRLMAELTLIHRDSFAEISRRLDANATGFAQKAYELWRAGDLTAINLLSEVPYLPQSCTMNHFVYLQ